MDTVLKYILLDNESDNIASLKSRTRNRSKNDVYFSLKSKCLCNVKSLSNRWHSSNAVKVLQQVTL